MKNTSQCAVLCSSKFKLLILACRSYFPDLISFQVPLPHLEEETLSISFLGTTQLISAPLFLKSSSGIFSGFSVKYPKLSDPSLSHSFHFFPNAFSSCDSITFSLFVVCFTTQEHSSKRPEPWVCLVPRTAPGMSAHRKCTLKAYWFKVILEGTHFSH